MPEENDRPEPKPQSKTAKILADNPDADKSLTTTAGAPAKDQAEVDPSMVEGEPNE